MLRERTIDGRSMPGDGSKVPPLGYRAHDCDVKEGAEHGTASASEQSNSAPSAGRKRKPPGRRRAPFTSEMTETLKLMYAAGCTHAEIAEELGVSLIHARSKASDLGICNRIKSDSRERTKALQTMRPGDAVRGLTNHAAIRWATRLKNRGFDVKRFASTNGTFGLRRLA